MFENTEISEFKPDDRFEKTRMLLPKLKKQHITPKLAYMARTDDSIVVKISKKLKIVILDDGTWEYL